MPRSYGPKPATSNTRGEVGVGSVLNTKHEGVTKRPTETKKIDELTADEIGKSTRKESPMNNPGFGRSSEKRG